MSELLLRPSDEINLAAIPCSVCKGTKTVPEVVPPFDGLDSDSPTGRDIPCTHCETSGYEPTGRDHLSHSSISSFTRCPRRFQLHYDARLELIADRSRPLGMGSAFQKALELGDPMHEDIEKLLREGVEILDQAGEDKLSVELATVRAAAILYRHKWPGATRSVAEYEFRVRLRNPWTGAYSRTFDLLGYADDLIDHGGWYELVENKFVGQISKQTIRGLNLDRQVGLVCYGIWRATGKKVREVKYRFIRKPSIKQKQNESVDEYIERLTLDYGERPEFYSDEQELFRTDEDLLRIEAELWDWAEQIRSSRNREFFTRTTSSCGDFGGCQFQAICGGDPDAGALYRTRPERIPTTTKEAVIV